VTLSELLAQLPGSFCGGRPRPRSTAIGEVRGVTTRLRDVRPGMAYFALPSEVLANPYAAHAACARGASVVVCESGLAVPARATAVRVADPRAALAAAAAAFRSFPAERLTLFGVVGEPTLRRGVTSLMAAIFNALGVPTATLGPSGFSAPGRRATTPLGQLDAVEVQGLLGQHVATGGRCVVVDFDPEALPDGLTGLKFARRIEVARWGGFRHLRPLLLHSRGSRVEILGRSHSESATTPLTGRRSLLALDQVWPELLKGAADLGYPAGAVRNALPVISPVSGWLEPVVCGQPAGVWVDAATDAVGLTAALRDAREMTPGRLHVVLGPRAAATATENAALGAAAFALADEVHVTTDNPRHRSLAELYHELTAAVSTPVSALMPDRTVAIRHALRRARPGDSVVLAGKADAPVQELGDVIVPFDDRWVAAEVLHARGFPGGAR